MDWKRNILWAALACGALAGLWLAPGLALTLALCYGIYRGGKALYRRTESHPRLRKVLRVLGICLAAVFAIAAPGLALLIALAAASVRGIRKRSGKTAGGPAARGPEGGPSPDRPSPTGPSPAESAAPETGAEPSKGRDFLKGLLLCLAAAGGILLLKLLAVTLAVGAGFALLFSSCVDHGYPHSRREVLAYVREAFPGEEVVVSQAYTNPENAEGERAENRVWTCYFADLPEAPFEIRSGYWNGGPVPVWGYRLSDTSQSAVRVYYLEKYLEGGGCLDLWEMDEWWFEMEFSSMGEVRAAAEQLEAYHSWYTLQPHAGTPPSAKGTLTGLRPPVEALFQDSTLFGEEDEGLEARCEQILKSYYAFYNLPSPDFSEEEILAYIQENWEWDGFVPMNRETGEWMSEKDFPDIRLERRRISFGGLYTVLERAGAAPEGTPEHYAVTGADGRRYEFSYDFQAPEGGEIRWYYLKDGERVLTGTGNYNAPTLLWNGDEIWAMLVLRDRKENPTPPEEAPPLELKPVPAA